MRCVTAGGKTVAPGLALSWLTPLATSSAFVRRLKALIAIARYVDDLVDGGSRRRSSRMCWHWDEGERRDRY